MLVATSFGESSVLPPHRNFHVIYVSGADRMARTGYRPLQSVTHRDEKAAPRGMARGTGR